MWATVEGIRTSTFFLCLGYGTLTVACAKGTDISPSEIVVIEPLAAGPSADAGAADAGAPADPLAAPEPALDE